MRNFENIEKKIFWSLFIEIEGFETFVVILICGFTTLCWDSSLYAQKICISSLYIILGECEMFFFCIITSTGNFELKIRYLGLALSYLFVDIFSSFLTRYGQEICWSSIYLVFEALS